MHDGEMMDRAICSLEASETVASHRWLERVPAVPVSEDDFYAEWTRTQLNSCSCVLGIFTLYL